MREIITIAFGSAKENYDQRITILGHEFRVKRMGVDFHFDLALELVKKYKDQCDLMTLSGFPTDVKIGNKIHIHHQTQKLREAAGDTPLTDGAHLKSVALPLFIKNLSTNEPHLFNGKKVAFFSGIVQWDYLQSYEEAGAQLIFADVYFATGMPVLIKGLDQFKKTISNTTSFLKRLNLENFKDKDFTHPMTRLPTMKDFFDSEIFIINETQMEYIKLPDLTGKTVIIDQIDNFSRKQIDHSNASKVYSCFPDFIGMPHLGFNGLEAVLLSITGKRKLDQEDLLEIIAKTNLKPEIYVPKSQNTKTIEKFSFVIHPLTRNQLFDMPAIKPFAQSKIAKNIEEMMKLMPAFHYAKISGIKSKFNGKEVEGDLFALPQTPKVMMKQDPEEVYGALVKICQDAYKKGSKLIGLGAYTKIVGDAGVTVNNRSPIPVTTGNSLSASATLWAASFGVEKMGMINKEGQSYQGTAMVVGATGSIGKVCSKILANHWKRLIVAAPRPYKVLELVNDLKTQFPQAEIIGTSNPDKYSSECDLIITTTSAQGERVLNIDLVKSGCVICDVSRPFDIPLEDAAKRPDVLIIASGEVELPGNVKLNKGIGLPGNTVYACLAETALLVMEGRFESFSLSRDLSYERVIEIDQLARKHGIRLSAIMGHTGEITEEEIKLCREHALKSAPRTSEPALEK